MPPKKAVKEEKIMLGRPGNNLKSGIVGVLSFVALLFFPSSGHIFFVVFVWDFMVGFIAGHHR